MSKQETQIIKGIAILMMLFLHLFNNGSANQLQHLLWIDNQPFLQILTRAANPIFFFCFCGGYGLYYTFQRGKDSHHYSRIMKLYVHYWIVLLIFVPLAHFISSEYTYPGNIQTILYNVTGLEVSWNMECWFLLPYALLSLTSKKMFSWMDKVRVRYVLGFTLLLYGIAGYLLTKNGSKLYPFQYPSINLFILYLYLLFPFTIGAMTLRTQVKDAGPASPLTDKGQPFHRSCPPLHEASCQGTRKATLPAHSFSPTASGDFAAER